MSDELLDDKAIKEKEKLAPLEEQGFFDKSVGIRWGIFVLFYISLFTFLHFREVSVEVLDLDTFATRYIVAQVDFEFLDREATIILKQEAVRDIGKIYSLTEKEVSQRLLDFQHYLTHNQDWRKLDPQSTFDEFYDALRVFEKNQLQIRFTDPRTLKKMEEVNLPTQFYQMYIPRIAYDPVTLPGQIWEALKDLSFEENNEFSKNSIEFIVDYFKSKEWQLEEDLSAKRLLGKQVQENVSDRYTKIKAGNRIIDQGDKVTNRHIDMLKAMKNTISENRNLWHPITLFGSSILTALLIYIGFLYFQVQHPRSLKSNRKISLFVMILVLTLIIAKAFEFFVLNTGSNFSDIMRYPLFTPFTAILLCSLMGSRVAIFGSIFLAVILSMVLAIDRSGFLLTNIITSLVVIISTRSLNRRKEVFIVCAQAWASCIIMILSFHFYENKMHDITLVADIFSSAIFMLFTAVVVVGLLPLLETGFRIVTDVTLMEFMDPSNPLLRRLALEAPGTYQHSIVVGNIAEAAALSIGANGLFCRVSTLYHDIGKLATPHYFTENQQGGINMHQLLTPYESAQVITAHVSEGVAIARKSGLPEAFIDIIKEHHGTTLVYYFYHKEVEQKEGREKEKGQLKSEQQIKVNERKFRYSGPKPRSKESAIIMIADSLEAASRSLDAINEESLTDLINKLIKMKTEDGQLDNCRLSFEELGIIKRTMVQTLCVAGHSRIKYPEKKDKSSSGK